MDGLYWEVGSGVKAKGAGLLLKYKNRGWWIDVEDDYILNNGVNRIRAYPEEGWKWNKHPHEDQILVLPWKPLLEWKS